MKITVKFLTLTTALSFLLAGCSDMGDPITNNGNNGGNLPYISPVVPNLATVGNLTMNFDLTPYEHDPEQPGAQLTWSASGLDPSVATAIINASTDVITLTPVTNTTESDVFTLILSDGISGLDSQSVTLTVIGGNSPTFSPDILPIFQSNCTSCHSGTSPLGELDLSTYATLMDSVGPHAPVIIPHSPDGSYLIQKIEGSATPQMPYLASPLPQVQIDLIRHWIAAGALDN